jgi:ectoine hydroxylase-related dioxygenase (phytanoyl-CoA dioxygenase family)
MLNLFKVPSGPEATGVALVTDLSVFRAFRFGAMVSWHQDNACFKISDTMKGTALWTAVHAATVANGTMHIIPDSMYEAYEHSRDPYSDHHIRCYPPEERAIPIELPAGGALLFAYGIAHCTRANNTDHERAGMAMHFLRADYAQSDLIDPARDTRPYLSGPQATGGLREYGVTVAGTWEQQVARML